MRMKSFAFGTLELVGDITDLTVKDGWLILNVNTTTPAGWTLRAAMTREDLWMMVRRMCKWSTLRYLVFGCGKAKEAAEIPDY